MNAYSESFCCVPPILRFVTCAAKGVGMAGVRVIVKATDRIEKFRDAKKMVCASCEAARQASKSQASRHLECSRAKAEPASKNTFVIVST